eukprot:TRINITY_DN467_c1_g1_i4.p1 TRINITY_DN467_c1_g1~~TRINITY_DN467_c1_g1_i4.p1  ORF type:complete len:223 (+),score=9.04 TRINITY_DN467_c1_g1_i4:222-890(+)
MPFSKAWDLAWENAPRKYTVLLDMAYNSLMKKSEIASMAQQLMHLYARQKRTLHPLNIQLCGLEGELREKLGVMGMGGWRVEVLGGDLSHAVRGRRAVYLSAESENVLENLDENATYIIGGIVDRNRNKGVSWERAGGLGVETARLPIQEYMPELKERVLTTCHVADLLLHYSLHGSWRLALEAVVPNRKRASHQEKRDRKEKRELRRLANRALGSGSGEQQ